MVERAPVPNAGGPLLPSARVAPATVGALVGELADALAAARVEAPRREARDVIAALLDVPRFWAVREADGAPPPGLVEQARAAVARRAAGAPFAYAVRRAAFRHFTLDVDERVLIPRPETELLPELVLRELAATGRDAGGTAVDVGTGSGAIALALAAEGAFERVIATDVSVDALAVARRNAAVHAGALRAALEFRVGSALVPLRGDVAAGRRLRAVVSNPPYIAFGELAALPAAVRDWEPALALSCGDDGLAVTRAIVRDAAHALELDGVLALEVDVRRAMTVAELVASHGAFGAVRVELDLTGRERFVVARREN